MMERENDFPEYLWLHIYHLIEYGLNGDIDKLQKYSKVLYGEHKQNIRTEEQWLFEGLLDD